MDELTIYLESSIQKVSQILKEHTALKKKYETISEENTILKKKLEEDGNKIKELEEKINAISISKKVNHSEISEERNDKELPATETREKINEYIREIDKCIKLLSD